MGKYITSIVYAVAVILLTACVLPSSGTSGDGKWQSFSGDKRIEQRVDSVLKLMTLEEKKDSLRNMKALR